MAVMEFLEKLKLRVKRGETPFFRSVRGFAKWLLRANLPTPGILRPILRLLYELHFFIIISWRWAFVFFYCTPLFRSRCTTAGRNLRLEGLPFVSGHVEIQVGDDVLIGDKCCILTGRFIDRPLLVFKDRSALGTGSLISVNKEVIIEEDVFISTNCRVSDSDGHPKQADLRAQFAPLDPADIRPVRICRHAWIGNGAQVMKGVTIGEGAIIGANSVVMSDIPPYCVAIGNPAEVYFRNVGRATSAAGNTLRSS